MAKGFVFRGVVPKKPVIRLVGRAERATLAGGFKHVSLLGRSDLEHIFSSLFEAKAAIPESLLIGLDKELRLTKETKISEPGLRFLFNRAMALPRFNMGYYVALLSAFESVLEKPGVVGYPLAAPVVARRPVRFVVPTISRQSVESKSFFRAVRHTLQLTSGTDRTGLWKPLRFKGEIEEEGLKLSSKVFWLKTGRAKSDFKVAKERRIKGLRAKQFLRGTPQFSIDYEADKRRLSRYSARFARSAHIVLTTGYPSWNPEFDTLITLPLSTGKIQAVRPLLPTKLWSSIDVHGKFPGSRYLVHPEHSRPWLRRLSYLAYLQSKKDLRALFR